MNQGDNTTSTSYSSWSPPRLIQLGHAAGSQVGITDFYTETNVFVNKGYSKFYNVPSGV